MRTLSVIVVSIFFKISIFADVGDVFAIDVHIFAIDGITIGLIVVIDDD